MIGVLKRGGNLNTECTEGRSHNITQRTSGENNRKDIRSWQPDILILNVLPQGLGKRTLLLFKSPSLFCFAGNLRELI